MRFLSWVSAVLFAAVFTVFGYFYFWHHTLSTLEVRLPTYLNTLMQGDVKYEHIVKHFDPVHAVLTIKGASWSFLNPEEGVSAVVSLGDLDVKGDLFSPTKLSVSVPSEIFVTVSKGRQTERYRINTSSGMFDVDLKKEDGVDLFFQTNLMIVEREYEGLFLPVFQTGYAYVDKKNMPEVWSTSINDIKLVSSSGSVLKTYDNIALSWHVVKPYVGSLMDVLIKGGVDPEGYIKTFVQNWFFDMQIDVSDARLTSGDDWYSLRGRLGVKEEGWLNGDFFVTTNHFDDLLNMIHAQMGSLPLALEKMMWRVVKTQGESQGVNFVLRDKKLYLNGSPAGEMPPVSDMLKPFLVQ